MELQLQDLRKTVQNKICRQQCKCQFGIYATGLWFLSWFYCPWISEKYVAKTIQEVQKLFENPDNVGNDRNEQFLIGNAYWEKIAPREKLLNLIANTYSKPNEILGYNNLPDLDIKDGTPFYQTIREDRIPAQ